MDQVSPHLCTTGTELCRYLAAKLPGIGGATWWETHVVAQLTIGQQGHMRARGIRQLAGLDLAALLRVFERNWAELSYASRLADEVRIYAKEVAAIRNSVAHAAADGASLPRMDLYRHLDTIRRLLVAIGTNPERLTPLTNEIERIISIHDAPATCQGPVAVPDQNMAFDAWKELPKRHLGKFTIHGPGDPQVASLPNFQRVPVDATIVPSLVTGPNSLAFIVHVVTIDDPSEDHEVGQVFCDSRLNSPQIWDDVVRRLRTGIRTTKDGMLTLDLRARCRENGNRAAWRKRSLASLGTRTGLNIDQMLCGLGACAVGTRQQLYGENSQIRDMPAVTFRPDDVITPVAAWIVTTMEGEG
jgi:hypothetical protein